MNMCSLAVNVFSSLSVVLKATLYPKDLKILLYVYYIISSYCATTYVDTSLDVY